jgi:prepilin-type N-terminal cleavage/methylation domain-containing protein
MKRQHGFTLIELITVIFILSILAIYAAPRLTSKVFDARAAAGELLEAIKYAQEMSMTHSGDTHYQVDLQANGYRVSQGGVDIFDPMTRSAAYSGTWSNIALGLTGTISFDSRGKPTCSGALPACSEPEDSDVSIPVIAGSDSVVVNLARLTGYAYAQ